jgi:hypothetical protein
MPIYQVGFTAKAGTNTANKIIANLWTATRRIRVKEVGIWLQTVTTNAPLFALQRSTARGTQTATLAPILQDPSDIAATATCDITWSADPTFTTTDPRIRVGAVALAAGNGVIWSLYDMEVAIGSGLAIINVNATGATLGSYAGYFLYDE